MEQNHWEIARFNKLKNENWMGLWIGPYCPESFDGTYDWLLSELNKRNCFDNELKFHSRDLLAIFIKNDNDERVMSFGFEWKEQKWVKRFYSPFDCMNYHDEKEKGVVKRVEFTE